jgi:2',3'-cyclic-nucleotide 2'-phosphodiesterase (5'-nucleotidase family)
MVLKIKHYVVFITILLISACKQTTTRLSEIDAKQIKIDSSIVAIDSIDSFVTPYRKRINEVLDSTLAYSSKMLTKDDGALNTSAGNLMADIVFSEVNPVFQSRTGNTIDFVLLNHGGIRSIISKGDVSARTAYEVMPFENSIVVVKLSGESILEMVDFLIASNRAHPIAGMQIIINNKNELQTLKIQGLPFNKNRNYFVATSNYLVTGGDNMGFFKKMLDSTDTNYLIRNAMIDYFKKVDTINAQVDDRFYKIN